MMFWLRVDNQYEKRLVQIKHIVDIYLQGYYVVIYLVNQQEIRITHQTKKEAEDYYQKIVSTILGK